MPDMSVLDDILLEMAHAPSVFSSRRQTATLAKEKPNRSSSSTSDNLLTNRSPSAQAFPPKVYPDYKAPVALPVNMQYSEEDGHYGWGDRSRTFPRSSLRQKHNGEHRGTKDVVEQFNYFSSFSHPSADTSNVQQEDEKDDLQIPCPYGTFLHLDFVDYCGKLSLVKLPESVKLFRRATAQRKKKWRKSMDQMLYSEEVLSGIIRTDGLEESSTNLINGEAGPMRYVGEKEVNSAGGDGLLLAVDTFEQTLKRHLQAGSNSHCLQIVEEEETNKFSTKQMNGNKSDVDPKQSPRTVATNQREDTTLTEKETDREPGKNDSWKDDVDESEASLLCGTRVFSERESLFTVPNNRAPKSAQATCFLLRESVQSCSLTDIRTIREPSPRETVFWPDCPPPCVSRSSNNVSISAEVLESIRHKMATALQQMRLMQTQMAIIPNLKAQIAVLQDQLRKQKQDSAKTSQNSSTCTEALPWRETLFLLKADDRRQMLECMQVCLERKKEQEPVRSRKNQDTQYQDPWPKQKVITPICQAVASATDMVTTKDAAILTDPEIVIAPVADFVDQGQSAIMHAHGQGRSCMRGASLQQVPFGVKVGKHFPAGHKNQRSRVLLKCKRRIDEQKKRASKIQGHVNLTHMDAEELLEPRDLHEILPEAIEDEDVRDVQQLPDAPCAETESDPEVIQLSQLNGMYEAGSATQTSSVTTSECSVQDCPVSSLSVGGDATVILNVTDMMQTGNVSTSGISEGDCTGTSSGSGSASAASSHSDDATETDNEDEGSYDLRHGHVSNKCFESDELEQKHAYALDTYLHVPQTLSKELMAACKVLRDYLQRNKKKTIGQGGSKIESSVHVIQQEWFAIAGKKDAAAVTVNHYVDVLESMSKALLHTVINLMDNNGNTVLHYALSHNNLDLVSVLLDSKVCDVDKVNKAGYTSVMLASLAQLTCDAHHQVAARLFRLGDVNRRALQHGQTALMLAVSHGRLDTVRMLLQVGADVNIQDNDGSTALMCASEHGHLEIVQLLLTHPDLDTQLTDQDGMCAFYVAMEAERKDIAAKIYARTGSVLANDQTRTADKPLLLSDYKIKQRPTPNGTGLSANRTATM